MDPARAAALHATLGLDGPRPEAGCSLPPFFHQVYFWDAQPEEKLGRDGHPAVGGFIPDLGFARRMWAGGRLEFHAPLRCGVPAERQSTIITIRETSGRTGPLAFVTLRHNISQNGETCVTEDQELVYRQDPAPDAPGPAPVQAPPDSEPEERLFSTTLLFRYSALTFNGHRIHYDADYARQVEGYDGLVVHGPILAQLLMFKAAAIAPLKAFSFRGLRALSLTENAVLNRNGNKLWVRNDDGQTITTAEAVW